MWWGWLKQRDTWLYFGIALLLRGPLFGILLNQHGLHSAWYGWGAETGDTPGYFEPIDSFLEGHGYRPDFRMPGYGLPYLFFRLFTTPQGAGSGIIVLQAILGILSVVVLARTAKILGAPRWTSFAVCIVYSLLGRVVVHDVYWFTESFCTSALIFGTHGWLAFRHGRSRTALIWAGCWLAWAVFLRPVQIVWLTGLVAHTIACGRFAWRERIVTAALLLLPFLLADAWWIRRNAVMHETFSPLSRGVIMPELANSPMFPLMRFLQATGGNFYHWDPSAHIRWFNMREGPFAGPGPRVDRGVEMPRFALCDRITEDSLSAWAKEMSQWNDTSINAAQRVGLLRSMNARSDRYVDYYAEDRPWQYHLGARIRLTGLLFRMTGGGSLFRDDRDDPQARYRPSDHLLDAPLHWLILIGGLVGCVIALWHWRTAPTVAFIALLALFSIFIIPWGLRLCEGRYLVPVYPWLLLLLVMGLGRRAVARSRATADRQSVPLVDQN
ncbi:MAG: hypothetical protein JNM91_07835 [Flavobacteriales bacterium]|nr:hypothetical protein [Flavobacteriales bacterium]